MTRAIVLRPEAVEDLRAARSWYGSRREGLGDELVASVEAVLEQARAAPEAFAMVHGEVRRVLVRRFPHAVFYVIEPRRLVVLAILHASRDPVSWPRG
jgi:plasmid stabilization system protein ParE